MVVILDLTKQQTFAVTMSVRIQEDYPCPGGVSHFDLQDRD